MLCVTYLNTKKSNKDTPFRRCKCRAEDQLSECRNGLCVDAPSNCSYSGFAMIYGYTRLYYCPFTSYLNILGTDGSEIWTIGYSNRKEVKQSRWLRKICDFTTVLFEFMAYSIVQPRIYVSHKQFRNLHLSTVSQTEIIPLHYVLSLA